MKGNVSFKVIDVDLNAQEKYAGKHVAIIKGKVVGWGNTVKEALEMARSKFPEVETHNILLRFIPQQEMLIL